MAASSARARPPWRAGPTLGLVTRVDSTGVYSRLMPARAHVEGGGGGGSICCPARQAAGGRQGSVSATDEYGRFFSLGASRAWMRASTPSSESERAWCASRVGSGSAQLRPGEIGGSGRDRWIRSG